MIWGDSHVFFWFHIRPLLLTFDSQPRDLCFVQPSGASLPSTEIGIPSRCSHPRGISIVFRWQQKKKKESHYIPCELRCTNTDLLLLAHGFHCFSVLSLLLSNFTYLSWYDETTSRGFQTCSWQRHQNIWREIWNLSASLFPSSLIYDILWASCQPLLTEIKVLPLSCRDIILYEYFAASITTHMCPLALIWLSPSTEVHMILPSSSSPSVPYPSLIMIHNNIIKTSIQGLRWTIPDFKNKRYPSWQQWIYVLFSYWQSHRELSLSSALFFVPFIVHLFLFPPCSLTRTCPFLPCWPEEHNMWDQTAGKWRAKCLSVS